MGLRLEGSHIVDTLAFAFDRRGAWVALAWFLAPVLAFGVILLVQVRRGRPGLLGLKGRGRVAVFSALVALYLATLYGWLFWRTFYDLAITEAPRRFELTFLLPERTLSLPVSDIVAVRQEPGPKGLGRRLLIETRDGTTYRSPVRSSREIADILAQLQRAAPR